MASTSVARIHDLPNEVLLSIFSFLPVVDLAHCAATCERWRGIVTECTDLWTGQCYVSKRSPTVSTEMRAVLHALPPLEEVFIQATHVFAVDIFYPRVFLFVMDVRAMQKSLRLRCRYLSARLDVVRDILSSRSILDFLEIQKLHILKTLPSIIQGRPDLPEVHVVGSALELFPNLEDLSFRAGYLSADDADYLDTLEGISRVRTLEIDCPCLEKLTFLRHCSRMLEELHLVGCEALTSQEYAELRQLENLRRLSFRNCSIFEGELAVVAASLRFLESLRVIHCGLIQDLSILQHCRQLRELCISNAFRLDALLIVTRERGRLWLRYLDMLDDANVPPFDAVGVCLTMGHLSDALLKLEELGLASSCLANLGSLRQCTQLRHLYCVFVRQPHQPELFNTKANTYLRSSVLI